MPQVTACSNCGTINTAFSSYCRRCGTPRRGPLLVWLALMAVSWFSWSLFTVNLFALTVEYRPQHIHIAPRNPKSVEKPKPSESIYIPPPQPNKPPESKDDHYIPNSTDDQGRKASFLISLLSDEYRWKLGRIDLLENLQTRINFTPEMRQNLNGSVEVICIGASSEEIVQGMSEEDGRRVEELRAGRRAEAISMWVRDVLSKPINVRKLNIGHRDPTANTDLPYDDTSDQRRVIIVLVLKEENGVNIDQALRNAFKQEKTKQPIYETILTKYSLTKGPTFYWLE